jgi:UDP-N-acetylmuramoyl-L-alanyl-D-glutamate--2,6-diaminopimelate ligase
VLLSQVIAGLPVVAVRGPTDVAVGRVDHDSRRVGPGSLFCCVPGARVDGHRFAGAAAAAGAAALLVERPVEVTGPTQVVVDDVRAAMALAAAAVAGHPSRSLTVVGITGTNGKTTTTFLVRSVLDHAGVPCAVLGTVSGPGGTGAGDRPPTTPDAPDLQRWLAERRDEGTAAVAMEVSSHSLASHRVDGTRFAVSVFTNLTPDHLDFHGDMESYLAAKARLFTPALSDRGIVNLDDPYGRRLAATAGVPVTGYGLADASDLRVGAAGSTFRWRGEPVRLALGARFNVANALAAAEAAAALGIDPATVAAGLSRPLAVPGRFEAVDEGQPFRVVVDYAHSPDGLEQVLRAAREVVEPPAGRVRVVFGCGGERDTAKRPLMGAVAARLADHVVLTADNSRHEDTRAIIAAVREGISTATGAAACEVTVEPDREAAIAAVLDAARPGDIVVIAGKGHETTLTIGDTVVDFDDREVARRHLRALLKGTAS